MKSTKNLLVILLLCLLAMPAKAYEKEWLLTKNWRFHKGNINGAEMPNFDDSKWQKVRVPHDWAISGPFDKEIDKQVVRIVQNGEKEASEKTGRSGSLPWIGEGWYRTSFATPDVLHRLELIIDGAMSEPKVYVNGKFVGEWKYGYSSFHIDITNALNGKGKQNILAIHLKNVEESSRWYPGAGLYRPVRLRMLPQNGIPVWGMWMYTTSLTDVNGNKGNARCVAETNVSNVAELRKARGRKSQIFVIHSLIDSKGNVVATHKAMVNERGVALSPLIVNNADLWSPENPSLYTLSAKVYADNDLLDTEYQKCGIRTVAVDAEHGFTLNGKGRKIKGVCLHHDLGALGAAVNRSALIRQLKIMKDMGADAIRTSHNMPAPWQMEICDSLGLMVMAESFDMWQYPKCKNGYARFYDEWWERDITNLILCHRQHPSIVMWSIGNEIPEQGSAKGYLLSQKMQELCHRLDPSRLVTQGCDRVDNAIGSGVLSLMDVPGLNYRTHLYQKTYDNTSRGFVLGSETTSTVSSRGVYKFPVKVSNGITYPDGQCSGYDLEYCSWSNLPEDEWQLLDDKPWTIGEFVWTGFDYLGEPTPYDNYWPSRSSYFGIVDLAGLPKDRYYLYKSRWNASEKTIHLLPHWTWHGHEGDTIPVFCYTNYPSAELFVNGRSQGRISKNPASRLDRYRLRWMNVRYEPGELKVVAYDENGNKAGEEVVRTAGKPHHIVLNAWSAQCGDIRYDGSRCCSSDDKAISLNADGEDMAFVTATIVDKDGNICPDAADQLSFRVNGNASFQAVCNGDATSTEVFTHPTMKTFHGQLVVIVRSAEKKGNASLVVTAKGLKGAKQNFVVK